MANDSGSSRTDTIVKVMLVFFISLLSFSVGTFVGKQVSDSDHRRLALESEFKDGREVASQDTTTEDAAKVSDKDVDNLADEFVNKEKSAEGQTAAASEGEAPKAEGKEGADGYKAYTHGAKEVTKDAIKDAKETKEVKGKTTAENKMNETVRKVANNEAPSDGQPETRKPSSTLPGVAESAIGKFTVQVASYATEDEAKGQASTLKNKGLECVLCSRGDQRKNLVPRQRRSLQ